LKGANIFHLNSIFISPGNHHNGRTKKFRDNRKKFQFVINDFVVREQDVNAECEINGLLQNFILKRKTCLKSRAYWIYSCFF
jgi:hypothetical protein